VLARLVGKQMEASLGQPLVVENRPGNSSMIAAEAAMRAPADGYTLFVATIANTLNPAETGSSFNLAKDFAPIALVATVPNVLVAHPSVPANNLAELIALAKSKPETLTFGSSGYATASYMRPSCSTPMRVLPSSWCPIRGVATRRSRTCSRAASR
jgi:tripartite-type tricarboxylate transporter receptor subunit TctC